MMNGSAKDAGIDWREWSPEAFDDAKRSGRLVLLDLSAAWCHWCHVMDDKTYSDPEVIQSINEKFVPIRVDVDKRPDISERYNKGGFPTTAFLSDRGETVWGGTYVPLEDMKEIIKAVLESQASGELGGILDRQRQQFLDLSKALDHRETVDSVLLKRVFEDIFSSLDPEWGGFGIEPKFPHPDIVDLFMYRYAETREPELKEAVRSTLDHMTEGLYDYVEGGLFRYSVTRNWKEPHYEKMLETNLGFLRNLAHAKTLFRDSRYEEIARGVADYLTRILRDPSGAFYSSQDADEEYYKLSAESRRGRRPPKVIKDIFSGWNLQAATAFIEAGAMFEEQSLTEVGRVVWERSRSLHWNPEKNLVKHEAEGGLYLFEDQVACLEALISVAEVSRGEDIQPLIEQGKGIVRAVDLMFKHPDGGYGDIASSSDAVGDLAEQKRPISANARWAKAIALFGALSFEPAMSSASWEILRSFTPEEVQSNGVFSAPYLSAWWVLERGPRLVEIHGLGSGAVTSSPLWLEGKRTFDLAAVMAAARPAGVAIREPERPFAVVCSEKGCSKEIEDPEALHSLLMPGRPGQV